MVEVVLFLEIISTTSLAGWAPGDFEESPTGCQLETMKNIFFLALQNPFLWWAVEIATSPIRVWKGPKAEP